MHASTEFFGELSWITCTQKTRNYYTWLPAYIFIKRTAYNPPTLPHLPPPLLPTYQDTLLAVFPEHKTKQFMEAFHMMSSFLRIRKYTKENSCHVLTVAFLSKCDETFRTLLVCVELGEIPPLWSLSLINTACIKLYSNTSFSIRMYTFLMT